MQDRLVLFGHGGSYNHGCEAIARSTLSMLDRLGEGRFDVELYSSNTASDRQFGLDRIVKLREQRAEFHVTNPTDVFAMLLRKCLHSDELYLKRFFSGRLDDVRDTLCLSVGGDMYCYGRLPWLYYLHKTLKQNGNRTLLWGCSVDKISFLPESLEDLRRYDRILVRESVSQELLQKHGFQNVALYPDPAFTLAPEPVRHSFALNGANTIALNISPLVRRYRGDSPLAPNVKNLIRHILDDTEFELLLLPHVNGRTPQEDDHTYLRGLVDEIGASERLRLLSCGYDCRELKWIISQCRLLLTARTHAAVAGYSTGVPTVALGYSAKARGMARDIFGSEEHFVVPVQNIEGEFALVHAFRWLLAHEDEIRTHLHAFMPGYIKRAYGALGELEALLTEN